MTAQLVRWVDAVSAYWSTSDCAECRGCVYNDGPGHCDVLHGRLIPTHSPCPGVPLRPPRELGARQRGT